METANYCFSLKYRHRVKQEEPRLGDNIDTENRVKKVADLVVELILGYG